MARLIETLRRSRLRYQRPRERWLCGREEAPCVGGPERSGACGGNAQCAPALRGERWHCTRPAHRGGLCEPGPGPQGECGLAGPPCRPRATPRSTRLRALLWLTALVIAAATLAVDRLMERFITPGPLAHAHAALGCAECHGAADHAWSEWPSLALAPPDDAHRCRNCHVAGTLPASAHGVEPARLAAHAHDGDPAPVRATPEAACAWCHREHRGTDSDLAAVPDATCNSCHREAFRGLAAHPPFALEPARPPVLHYDHAAHTGKHFTKDEYRERAPAGCTACHRPDDERDGFRTPNYAGACAACHQARVFGDALAGAKGIPVFALPGLDRHSLAAAGFAIGDWPEDADARLEPLTAVLALGPEAGARIGAALEGVDLLDLREAGPDQLQAAADLAWATKALLQRLAREGQPVLRARFEAHTGRPLSRAEAAALAGGLEPATVTAALAHWFPRLDAELAALRAGEPLPGEAAATGPASAGENGIARASADSASDDSELLAGGGGALRSGDEDLLPGNGDALLTNGDDLLADDGDALLTGLTGSDDLPAEDGDALLADGDDLLAGGGDDLLAGDGDDLLTGGDDLLAGDELPENSGGDPGMGTTADGASLPPSQASPEAWTDGGGWYRDYTTLRYRPEGHADRWLHATIDLLGQTPGADARAALRTLTDAKAPGACGKCHRQDERGTLHWQQSASPETGFTRFSHRPHLNDLNDATCEGCHAPEPQRSEEQREFAPLERKQCVECHRPGAAPETCTTCHRYHVDGVAPAGGGDDPPGAGPYTAEPRFLSESRP